jgi:predicted permease
MVRKFLFHLRTLFRRKSMQAALEEEVQSHLRVAAQERMEQGESAEQARTAALREFGNVGLVKEVTRDVWGWGWLADFLQDLRYGVRMLRRNPGFSTVAVLSLALGIGANTAIFSLLNAVMLRELPVERPGQLVLLGTGLSGGSTDDFAATNLYSYPFYRELRRTNQVFSDVSAVLSLMFEKMHGAVGASPDLEPMNVQMVSGAYFPMLGVRPILGRAFSEAEDEPAGGHPVAVMSYSWWARRFSRDAGILGKTVTLGSTVYSIVGVAPPEFFGTTVGQSPDLWIPLSMEKQVSPGWNGLDDKWFQSLHILGRLKPGVSREQAEANVNLLARQIWHEHAGPVLSKEQQQTLERAHIRLTPAARGLSRLRFEFSLPLQILMVLVGLVLLIACANIANLLLARATARQREIAVRMAMGAGRTRLIRQMLTESLVVAFLGGGLGILFAAWASGALLAMVSAGSEPLPLNVAPDARVLAFTLLVSLATALLFGTAPALRATRINLSPALKERTGVVSVASRSPLAKALIVGQVALSLVLLIGAALFLRTLVKLAGVDTGFNKDRVLLFGIDPPAVGYKEDQRLVSLYQQIESRVSAVPGVRAASISFFTFNQGEWDDPVVVQGGSPLPGIGKYVLHNVVGPGYFSAMGIPSLVGRVFDDRDTATSPKVAVINETMARQFFPGGSPIGRRFGIGGDPKHSADIEVVGVVKDAKYESLRERLWPAAYYPYTQRIGYYYDFEVRYSGNPQDIVAEVRRAIGEVDRSLPVAYQSTLAQQVERSIAGQTLIAQLSSFFGLLAVFLACVGIYGVMSYAVTRRTNEIGVRMALGADPLQVLWMVMRESLILVAQGLVVGLGFSLAGERLVKKLLFGLAPTDPLSLVGGAVLLLAFALLAGYLPARKASRVDPMVALRYE